MVINPLTQNSFGEELESIAQARIQIAKLSADELAQIEKIRSIERTLIAIRAKKRELEAIMLDKCDILFNKVYDQLPVNGKETLNG